MRCISILSVLYFVAVCHHTNYVVCPQENKLQTRCRRTQLHELLYLLDVHAIICACHVVARLASRRHVYGHGHDVITVMMMPTERTPCRNRSRYSCGTCLPHAAVMHLTGDSVCWEQLHIMYCVTVSMQTTRYTCRRQELPPMKSTKLPT